MRKISSVIFLLFVVNISFAQSWLDIGLKGGYGYGILNNANIWDDTKYNHRLNGSGFFGGKLGLNFNENHEITVDFIYGNFKQGFQYDVDLPKLDSNSTFTPTEEHNSEITFTTMDIILMYRHNKDGRYVEIGPRISLISNSKRTDDYYTEEFNQNYFNSYIYGMTFGFGGYMVGTENIGITAGARLGFGFSDLISEEGKAFNMPTLKAYDSYKGTFPVTLQLVFEANLDFAYMAKAQCGRRKLLTF